MLTKLAIRNVKRQIGNYLIYFFTVSLTVALMFAVNNVIFSEALLQKAEIFRELKSGLIGISVFVALIVAFVLGYATSFMLKLRKREFGTYLTLGMTRKNILSIFVLETMILCAAALLAGMLFGLFVYQGLMLVISNLMEMEFAFAAYSVKGLVLTVVLVCGVFGLASVTSALYLKRVSIYQLIHGDKVVDKQVKHPVLWFEIVIISFAAILCSCLVFYKTTEKMFTQGGGSGGMLFGSLAVLAGALVFFHIGLARSAVYLLLKSERFCSRGTNTFTLRQLSGKLRSNAVMAGALAFLIAFAVILANVSFVQKVSEESTLDQTYPFDINIVSDATQPAPVSEEQADKIIRSFVPIEEKMHYAVYTTKTAYLYSFTRWTGDGYEGLEDSIMAQSDINRLYRALGRDPVQLDGGFKILCNVPQVTSFDFSKAKLEIGGKTYAYTGIADDMPYITYDYFIAVVPDEAAQHLSLQSNGVAYTLKNQKFDAQALHDALSYPYTTSDGAYTYDRCDYHIREYGRMQRNSNTAVFVTGALYVSIVFVFLAMAILALKTLSGLSDDRRQYSILFRLGAGEREQSKTLFWQTFSFFFLPFALPILLSIPTGMICAQIMRMAGLSMTGTVYLNTGLIALCLIAVYLLYFTATYLLAKKTVVRSTL